MLETDLARWSSSEILTERDEKAEEPESTYAVGSAGTGGDVDAVPVPLDEKRKYAQRAVEAWTENGDL